MKTASKSWIAFLIGACLQLSACGPDNIPVSPQDTPAPPMPPTPTTRTGNPTVTPTPASRSD